MDNKIKNISIKSIFNIAKIEYKKFIVNPRMIIILVMLIFINDCAINPLLNHADKLGEKINLLEPFIAVGNSKFLLLVIPSVFMLLMSDFPKSDGNTIFLIIRAGRINWLFGQITFSIMSIVSYIGMVFLGTIIPIIKIAFVSKSWSNVITKYNNIFQEDSNSFSSMLITGNIYNQMNPIKVFTHTVFLTILYLFVITLILLLFYLLNLKFMGILINCLIMSLGSAFAFIESNIMWIMPVANSIISLHYSEIYKEPIVPIFQSYLYFFVLLLVLIITSLFMINRYNFSNIKEI